MAIIVNLDVMLARRKMRSKELAARVGITEQNISLLKSGKVKGIRFETLDKICDVLDCQPGDILEYRHDEEPGRGHVGPRRIDLAGSDPEQLFHGFDGKRQGNSLLEQDIEPPRPPRRFARIARPRADDGAADGVQSPGS